MIINDVISSAYFLNYYYLIILGIFLYFQNRIIKPRQINKLALSFSFTLILLVIIKSFFVVSEEDLFIYFSTPILLFSMIIILKGFKNFFYCFDILTITSLLVLRPIVIKTINIFLVPITSIVTWFNLNFLGIEFNLTDNILYQNKSGIIIEDGCSGASSIVYCLTIALIISTIFFIDKFTYKFIFYLISIIIGFVENVIRLSILAYLASINNERSITLFNFFHYSFGSWIFPLLSTLLIIYLYILILESKDLKNYE